MAQLHCHGCSWSQDDFWSFRFGRYGYTRVLFWKWAYNPFSLFISYLKGYWKPRRIEHDTWCAEDRGWKRVDPHSWWLLWHEFTRMICKLRRQKWWTETSFKLDCDPVTGKWPKCPKCGHGLDID